MLTSIVRKAPVGYHPPTHTVPRSNRQRLDPSDIISLTSPYIIFDHDEYTTLVPEHQARQGRDPSCLHQTFCHCKHLIHDGITCYHATAKQQTNFPSSQHIYLLASSCLHHTAQYWNVSRNSTRSKSFFSTAPLNCQLASAWDTIPNLIFCIIRVCFTELIYLEHDSSASTTLAWHDQPLWEVP